MGVREWEWLKGALKCSVKFVVKMQEQEKEGMVDILKEKVFFSDSN